MDTHQLTRHARPATRSLAVVSTYPPTKCGLATFSDALVTAITAQPSPPRVGVVEVVDQPQPRRHPHVVGQYAGGDERAVTEAAAALAPFDIVVLQHEYGIYPGPDGAAVLCLLDRLSVPVVTVLHTVLTRPTASQRLVLEQVVARSDAVVVMTETARERLVTRYRVHPERVHVIPHGTNTACGSAPSRDRGRPPVLLTWGLLGPGKGIEHAIDALASLRDLRPRPRYVVAGQTHPKLGAQTGERYRAMLVARARARGVADMLEFDDRYLSRRALTALIGQADVVVLPYESREQVTSGVLVDAVACHRPVVATAFPHAVELLGQGAGLTVPHGDVAGLAGALRRVLVEPGLAVRLRAVAGSIAPSLSWKVVADRYLALARDVAGARTPAA